MSVTLLTGAAPAMDRHDPREAAGVAAKAYARIAAAWKLKNAAAADLISVSTRTWARMKKQNWDGALKKDQLLRISALVGLYKALHLYFSDELADRWVSLPNNGPLFRGRTPEEFMVEGGLPAIMDTRDYIDAVRGGV